jgi:adenylate cyclase
VADEREVAQREEAALGRLARLREAAVNFDSHPAVVEAVGKLRRRVPGDKPATEGHSPSSMVARGVSALEPDRPSAIHEFGLGALQFWQSLADSAGTGRGERETTIVFTDLVGFSSWALDAGDETALELLRAVGDVVEDAFVDAGGIIVKRLGDGIMVVFDDPAAAVDASLDAQDAIAGVEVGGYRPKMRVGVHHGCPKRVRRDYLGVDVNVAARVAEQAKGGEVLVSEPTLDVIGEARWQAGRAKRLKAEGAPRDLRVRPVCRERG